MDGSSACVLGMETPMRLQYNTYKWLVYQLLPSATRHSWPFSTYLPKGGKQRLFS